MKIRITYDSFYNMYFLEGRFMFWWYALDFNGNLSSPDFGITNIKYFNSDAAAEKHIYYLKGKKECKAISKASEDSKDRYKVIKVADTTL